MNRIDPDRLTQLRAARGLSRQRLAERSHVSARQIARLEVAEEPTDVRATTMSRLASALDVEPAVLAGETPIPGDRPVADVQPVNVLPDVLAALRKRKGWSRRQLADVARVSPQMVERAERQSRPVSVRERTLGRLARALAVEESVLRGEKPLEPAMPTPDQWTITVRSAPGLRLAYEMVERRYGATAKDLFVLAPALFVLLAEGSLQWRRNKLEQARQASKALDELGQSNATLYFAQDVYQQAFDWGMATEEASIKKGDVLGREIWDEEGMQSWGFTEDDVTVTPFADYLEELAEKVDRPEMLTFHDLLLVDQGLDVWGANPYAVCRGDLDEIAGGSRHARWALEWGNARISDIPENLMSEEAKDDRAEWLASKLADDVREKMEQHEALLEDIARSFARMEADREGE